MKSTYYFPHDYNSRNDDKITDLLSIHGWSGYGLYWALVEKLYEGEGALIVNFKAIAFNLQTQPEIIESIVRKFDLFYIESEKIRSKSVDRRLQERLKRSQNSRIAGKASAYSRQPEILNSTKTQQTLSIR